VLIAQSEQLPERQGVNIALKEMQEIAEEEMLNIGNTAKITDYAHTAKPNYLMMKTWFV
jgi:hypothetical protein